jgi:hypothetical protein
MLAVAVGIRAALVAQVVEEIKGQVVLQIQAEVAAVITAHLLAQADQALWLFVTFHPINEQQAER